MPGVAGRSRVVVKMPAPVCGAHYQIHHEVRMYEAFPPDLMNTSASRVPEHVRPILFEPSRKNEKRRSDAAAAAAAEQQDPGKTKTKFKSAPIKMWQSLLKKASKRKAQPEAQKDERAAGAGVSRTQRSFNDPSWRLIDHSCGDGLALRGDDQPFYQVEFRSAADADP
ncbi:hypothetical protein C8Q76DRAFT_694217 [Earliella scabrosa]|nr:hypothetical protein C8Q76DRAFT_694217 [Earliella scabrosa]